MNTNIPYDVCPCCLVEGQYGKKCSHCGFGLDARIRKPVRIQLMGEVYSGKTTFLVSALNKTKTVLAASGVEFTPWLESSGVVNWYNEILDKHRCVPATQPGRCPLMFCLERENKRPVFVSLYDPSGFTPRPTQEIYNVAPLMDAFIIVLDPVQILPVDIISMLELSDVDICARDFDIGKEEFLSAVGAILGSRYSSGRAKKSPLSVAVVLNKGDLLQGSQEIIVSGNLEDAEGFLGTYFPDLLTLLSRSVRNYRYFFVSATGCSCEGNRYDKIEPYNVERPLLWLLKLLTGVGVIYA